MLTGVTSPGTGNDTAIAQLVAAELGVALEDVEVVQGDTDRCPYGFGNISSRSIVTGGSAAVLAARDIASKLRTVAAAMLHAQDGEDVVLADGMARRWTPSGPRAHRASWPAPCSRSATSWRSGSSRTSSRPGRSARRTSATRRTHRGNLQVYTTYPFAMHVSLVEVDEETGVVRPCVTSTAHDCGTVVNPAMVDGQMRGGA